MKNLITLRRIINTMLTAFLELLCDAIHQRNVLVIDDIATSGSTLNEVLRSLRLLNEDNKISIFSLIGRKDLTIESME